MGVGADGTDCTHTHTNTHTHTRTGGSAMLSRLFMSALGSGTLEPSTRRSSDTTSNATRSGACGGRRDGSVQGVSGGGTHT